MAVFRGANSQEVVARFEMNYGPWKMAQATLGEGWIEVRAELAELISSASEPVAGGVGAFAEYLLVVARKRS
jgi:hypothetical protein